jgi:hypothetical protein
MQSLLSLIEFDTPGDDNLESATDYRYRALSFMIAVPFGDEKALFIENKLSCYSTRGNIRGCDVALKPIY